MKDNKKFSILTACYNPAYLGDWRENIIKQTYRPLEVVFINDCYPLGMGKHIEAIRRRFKENGIDFVYKKNEKRMHYASSLLEAFNLSSGYYLGILDADDTLKKSAVDIIVDQYEKHQDIGWIYTQFEFYTKEMRRKGKGWSVKPKNGESLLDMGKRNKHAYSHWRTFSLRVADLESIFSPGLKSAVDKYMGYRLEELHTGGFFPVAMYNYRWGVPNCISKTEKARQTWYKVIEEFDLKRKKHGIVPYEIKKV